MPRTPGVLVNDNPVDNNLKGILVYVYFGSIVNNRPKNSFLYVLYVSPLNALLLVACHINGYVAVQPLYFNIYQSPG